MFNDFRIGWKKGLVALAIIALFIWRFLTKKSSAEKSSEAWMYYAKMFGWSGSCRQVFLTPKDNVKEITIKANYKWRGEHIVRQKANDIDWSKYELQGKPYIANGGVWQNISVSLEHQGTLKYIYNKYIRDMAMEAKVLIADFKVKDCTNDWSNVSEIEIILPKIPVNG